MGEAFPVLEILLHSTFLQIFPLDHDYKHLGVTKLNWLKKCMEVEVDVKCMKTKFGGCRFSSFRDFAPFSFPFKTAKIFFQTMDTHEIQKIESAQKCMQV